MQLHRFINYFLFCFYLLISIPVQAGANITATSTPTIADKNINLPIKINKKTPALTLIFKKNAKITDLYLVNPKGESYSVAKKADGILATAKNEAVRIKNPVPGLWLLSGPQSQVSQILILTDVNLNTNLNSGNYFTGEFIKLTGFIEHDYEPITTDLALQDMNMTLELSNTQNHVTYFIPYYKKGVFSNELILEIPAGTYNATWQIQDPFLSITHQLTMVMEDTPFALKAYSTHDNLLIEPLDLKLIKQDTVKIKVLDNNVSINPPIIKTELGWVINFLTFCHQKGFEKDNLVIEISAQSASDRNMLFKLLVKDEICSNHYTPLNIEKFNPKATKKAEQLAAKKKPKKHAWGLSRSVIVVLILVLVVGVLLLGIWYWNKKSEVREKL